MILKTVELIETELDRIPVLINEAIKDGKIVYQGKTIFSEINIFIETPTKESCLIGIKNAFELHMNFWLEKQLLSLKINLS